MHPFVHRYELDTSRPTAKEVLRDVGLRAFVPGAVLWVLIVATGFLVRGPLGDLPGEVAVNRWFEGRRTPTWDAVTDVLSLIGTTEFIIGGTLLTVLLVWWRTRQWWFAVVPALAVALQALIFLTSSIVVGRERPDVSRLDEAPPTSSFPSGHTGASAAFYLTLMLLAQRITHPVLRVVVTILCCLVPLGVGVSRLYRGAHGTADVVAGLVNGVVCCVLAWNYLRRDVRAVTREHR